MTGWRAALRMARREARRAKGRSALVLAMIALPVAALAFAAASYDTFTLTPDERADRLMGTAQAAVDWPHDGPVEQYPLDFVSFPLTSRSGRRHRRRRRWTGCWRCCHPAPPRCGASPARSGW